MLALQALTPHALHTRFPDIAPGEARKAVAQIHRHEPLKAREGLRRVSVETLLAHGHVPSLTTVESQASGVDPFCKWVLQTHDAQFIETVRIPLEKAGRFSVCVSSQVGCALGCRFCATGKLGLTRNLEAWEIVEQVRIVRQGLPAGTRVHGVVFQGMGEPLANLDRVLQAIEVMHDSSALAIDGRNITVCTSGLPSGIVRLAHEAPTVRLGLSLSSAREHVRRQVMPIADSHALSEVMDAVAHHALTTGLSPMWAVTLLHGVNDSAQDAHALADLAHAFKARTQRMPRITLIPYNKTAPDGEDPYARTPDEVESAYRDVLGARGLPTHKRYSGGQDVAAACGQLAARSPLHTIRSSHASRP